MLSALITTPPNSCAAASAAADFPLAVGPPNATARREGRLRLRRSDAADSGGLSLVTRGL
jgi:hypothetical protein